MRRPNPIPIVLGVVVLIVLWLVRPIWHGLAMFFWTAPVVWFPPLLLLAIGAVLFRRSRRSWTTLEDLRSGVRPPGWLIAFPVLAFVVFVFGAALNGPLVGRAIVNATNYEEINGLPAGGRVRIVPREVAEQNAASAFNSPTETLTNFRIVNTPHGLSWTALRTPEGIFRVFTKKSQGLVELDAEQTARSLRQVDAKLQVAPGLQITDNLRWKLLKKHFLINLEEPVGIETPKGVRILVPYLKYKGWLVRRPVLGGVFVVAPNGDIEDLSPEDAAKRPELAITGRIFPDTQARRVQDAYQYKKGLWNAWFVHENQTRIEDTETNKQPYLVDFGGTLGTQWVTVAEPYGRAFAASAIFLTDATTGKTRIWRVPPRTSLAGNRRAIQAVKAVAIQGIDYGNGGSTTGGGGGSGNFKVVEPRPVFVKGRLVYLTSIIPNSANAVSKTVVVDAATSKLVAIFDNDRDPQAETKTLRYIETGVVPDEAVASGTQTQTQGGSTSQSGGSTGATGGTSTTSTTSTTPAPATTSVERRIDAILRRQRELLQEIERLRESVHAQKPKKKSKSP